MKAAIYARVSTRDQKTDLQLDELRAYCARRGFEIAGVYEDEGWSGAKESRPALNRLMVDARRRKFDAVVVYRFDRFARSLRQLINALGEFDALGLAFISLHEGTDTSTPQGKLVFSIFGALAEFERSLIRERVLSGQAAAKRRGIVFGRPRAALDLAHVRALRASGASFRKIGMEFGVNAATVCRALAQAAAPAL